MNSFNHYSFGIQRDESGFRKFILQPEPDPTGAKIGGRLLRFDYGRIASAWKIAGNSVSAGRVA